METGLWWHFCKYTHIEGPIIRPFALSNTVVFFFFLFSFFPSSFLSFSRWFLGLVAFFFPFLFTGFLGLGSLFFSFFFFFFSFLFTLDFLVAFFFSFFLFTRLENQWIKEEITSIKPIQRKPIYPQITSTKLIQRISIYPHITSTKSIYPHIGAAAGCWRGRLALEINVVCTRRERENQCLGIGGRVMKKKGGCIRGYGAQAVGQVWVPQKVENFEWWEVENMCQTCGV